MKKVAPYLQSVFSLTSLSFALIFLSLSVTGVQASTQMPAFSLENVRDGKVVESSAFAGKVLLVSFFATWCPPCIEEVPNLNRLQNELADSGFSVIALSVDQGGPAVVRGFVDEKSVNYPVLMADLETTMDFGGIYGIPVAFLVNKSGNVVKKYTGYVQYSILKKDITSLLN